MIELKYTGQEDALEESVLTLLQDYDMVDECIIGSMNKGTLQKMKELEPGISTVLLPMIWKKRIMSWTMPTAIASRGEILRWIW